MIEAVAVTALVLAVLNSAALLIVLRELAASHTTGTSRGLALNTRIPDFAGRRPDGSALGASDVAGTVLLFLASDCTACHQLATDLANARERARLPRLTVGMASETPGAANEELDLRFVPPDRVFYDEGRVIAQTLRVPGTPFAYAVDAQQIVRGKRAPVGADDVRDLGRFT